MVKTLTNTDCEINLTALAAYPSGLRERFAKPRFAGSNPAAASNHLFYNNLGAQAFIGSLPNEGLQMLQEEILSFALLGAEWILWVLIIISVAVAAVAIERAYFLRADTTPSDKLAAAVNPFLEDGDTTKLCSALSTLDGFEARQLLSGSELAEQGTLAMERAFSGNIIAEKLKMDRGLALLATVGSNAPFIGLLGTVLGIMQAFADLAADTSNASASVMSGISEALVATAVGLFVAIPAVVLFNFFGRWVKRRMSRVSSISELILAKLTHKDATHGH
jgi:biopolymer transport protein ExbB